MTKAIGHTEIPSKKTELPLNQMLVAVALVGASLGYITTSAHNWVDYGFAAVDVLLLTGLIRSIAGEIRPRLTSHEANAQTSTAKPQGSDAR
ncbi:hypothetical protein [Paraburkholderia sp. A3RO-2L]|jgi:F0F1-type ATP synthase assembly protein I|uniref:hypothetical protein n=1 Tax=unclassified Paraburkholderia TaxID=2615204 RepID=UPI003DA8BF1F